MSAASQFARSKRALVSRPGTRQKKPARRSGANKNHLHFLALPPRNLTLLLPRSCTRPYVGGKDGRLKGRTSRALFVQRRASKVLDETKGQLLLFDPLGRLYLLYPEKLCGVKNVSKIFCDWQDPPSIINRNRNILFVIFKNDIKAWGRNFS